MSSRSTKSRSGHHNKSSSDGQGKPSSGGYGGQEVRGMAVRRGRWTAFHMSCSIACTSGDEGGWYGLFFYVTGYAEISVLVHYRPPFSLPVLSRATALGRSPRARSTTPHSPGRHAGARTQAPALCFIRQPRHGSQGGEVMRQRRDQKRKFRCLDKPVDRDGQER